MNQLRLCRIRSLARIAIGLSVCSSAVLLNAQTNAKKPPAKQAAAPARAGSAPAKPAGASVAKPGATNRATANAPTANRSSAPIANGSHPTGSARAVANTAGGSGGARGGAPSVGRTATGHIAPAGSHTITTRSGAITRRADGHISDVHDARRGMDIHHGLDGSRRVSVQRRDGSRLVAERGRRGFVERPYKFHGHDFARRSYYDHGVRHDRFYNHYYYHGAYVDVYAPPVYFASAFYGWAYNPWVAPITYAGWGWAGAPWYGFYGAYFTPSPVYLSAAFWLADYMLAADLQAVYMAQAGAVPEGGAAGAAPATPPSINEQEGGPGPANEHNLASWVWDGQQYEMTFNGSHCGNLTVVQWNDDRIVLSRTDFNGFRATYVGKPTGSGSIAGVVTWLPPGQGPGQGTWSAFFSAPPPAPADGSAAQPASVAGATPLSPEVKQAIADEVKNQLALENAEAAQVKAGQDVDAGSSGIARIIQDVGNGHSHLFVVGDSLDVTNASTQQECHLSEGDAVQLATAPPPDATAANVIVKSSKGGVECTANITVAVNLSDLQEMQNHMREQIDAGLKDMQSKAGTGGLPQPPASAKAAPTEPQYAAIAPPPSPQDQSDLEAQDKEAGTAESEAQQGGTPTTSSSAPAPNGAGKAIAPAAAALSPTAGYGGGLPTNEAYFDKKKEGSPEE